MNQHPLTFRSDPQPLIPNAFHHPSRSRTYIGSPYATRANCMIPHERSVLWREGGKGWREAGREGREKGRVGNIDR